MGFVQKCVLCSYGSAASQCSLPSLLIPLNLLNLRIHNCKNRQKPFCAIIATWIRFQTESPWEAAPVFMRQRQLIFRLKTSRLGRWRQVVSTIGDKLSLTRRQVITSGWDKLSPTLRQVVFAASIRVRRSFHASFKTHFSSLRLSVFDSAGNLVGTTVAFFDH